jgi:hypothetical protein
MERYKNRLVLFFRKELLAYLPLAPNSHVTRKDGRMGCLWRAWCDAKKQCALRRFYLPIDVDIVAYGLSYGG